MSRPRCTASGGCIKPDEFGINPDGSGYGPDCTKCREWGYVHFLAPSDVDMLIFLLCHELGRHRIHIYPSMNAHKEVEAIDFKADSMLMLWKPEQMEVGV